FATVVLREKRDVVGRERNAGTGHQVEDRMLRSGGLIQCHLEGGSALARGAAVPAGDRSRLLDPSRQQLLVERIRLAHIQGAHVLERTDGRRRLERGSL